MKLFGFGQKPQEHQESEETPKSKVRRVYFDYASITPIDPDVIKAMKPYSEKHFYNPSSIYTEGVESKRIVAEARRTIAGLMNIQSDDIIFTSSGTESNNLAILGVFNAYTGKKRPHIITSSIEHPSILETCKEVERLGGQVTYIEPDADGIIDPQKIKAALKPSTILVSIMYANNEIGTIQPVGAIGRIVKEHRAENAYPFMHTDASQAANFLPIHIGHVSADMMTLDGCKVYGPRGIGILAVRKNVAINPIMFGGGQERGLRAGTENVAAIVGVAKALQLSQEMMEQEGDRLFEFQQFLIDQIQKKWPEIIIHGLQAPRLPNIVNICKPGLDSEFAVIKLDREGIAASAASACQSNAEDNYSVTVGALPEIGEDCKRSSLRFSMGRDTTREDVERLLVVLEKIL